MDLTYYWIILCIFGYLRTFCDVSLKAFNKREEVLDGHFINNRFIFWYGLLSLPDHQYWTEGVGMVPVSFFLGIIVILFGLIPSALTAVFSDIFKRIFLKFAPKRGRYYWMIVTVLMGVMLSVIYGLGLKEGRDIWFFIDISLFCTLYSIFFLSLQDYYKHRNNRLIQRSFEDDF